MGKCIGGQRHKRFAKRGAFHRSRSTGMVICYDEEKVTTSTVKQDKVTIQHFSLQGKLASGYILALNLHLGTLSYLCSNEDGPQLVVQKQFTRSELSLLLPLLESFPHHCPYEVLYAHFYNGTVTEQMIEDARQHLQEALDRGTWDQELRPLRNVLSRTRIKLRAFGLNVSSILETGCIVM